MFNYLRTEIAGIILVCAVAINFVLFYWHKATYKDSKHRFRRMWGLAFILVGIGLFFYFLPTWVYYMYRDLSTIWLVIFLCGSGFMMLTINKNIRFELHIVIVPLIFHYITFVLQNRLYWRGIFSWHLDDFAFSRAWFFLIASVVLGIGYFTIRSIITKSMKHSTIPALQVIAIFSALPYIPTEPNMIFHPNFALTGIAIAFYILQILPEAIGFSGLTLLRARKRVAGGALIALAVLLGIEIVPIRMAYKYDYYVLPFIPSDYHYQTASVGERDRESEFKRSLHIIETLAEQSAKKPTDNLDSVIIYIPQLNKYPNILQLDTCYDHTPDGFWFESGYMDSLFFPGFERKMFLVDTTIDSDGDGLDDFSEAEILCDAYSKDSDGDGIDDKIDSDPLNPYVESEVGKIRAAVLEYFRPDPDSSPFYLVENRFYNGQGEIANFDRHIIVLYWNQVNKWNIIFGEQYICHHQRSLYGQYVEFGKHRLDLTGRIAVIGLHQHHGIWSDSGGWQILMVKPKDNWFVFAVTMLWT